MNLNAVKAEAAVCERCPLSLCRSHSVFEDGVRHAHIMLIGEAPGEQEDDTGRPFVGRSGQLLDAFITRTGLYRDRHLYITNLVKCRPPANRVPNELEIDACSRFLDAQLMSVKPDIIMLIGGTAWKAFSERSEGITKVRGKWFKLDGYLVMPVLHPSYLLRTHDKFPNRNEFATEEEYNLAIVDRAAPDSNIGLTRADFLTMKFKRDEIWASQMLHPSLRS